MGLVLVIMMVNVFNSHIKLSDDKISFSRYFGFSRKVFRISEILSITLVYHNEEIIFGKHTGFKFISDYEITVPKSTYERKDMVELIQTVLKLNKRIKPTHDLKHYLATETKPLSLDDVHISSILKNYKITRVSLLVFISFYIFAMGLFSYMLLTVFSNYYELTSGIVLFLIDILLVFVFLSILNYRIKLDRSALLIRNFILIEKEYSLSELKRTIKVKNKRTRNRSRAYLELQFKKTDKKLILKDVTLDIIKHLRKSRFTVQGYIPNDIR